MQFTQVRTAFRDIGSVRFFRTTCRILELSGLSNFPSGKSRLRNRAQQAYVLCVGVASLVFVVAHAWSTATRARRYTPEFLQCLLEDLILWMTGINAVLTCLLQARKFVRLIEFMERRFLADAQVARACAVRVRRIIVTYCLCCLFSVVTVILQVVFPLSPEEIRIRQVVYPDTAHLERILPVVVKIPGVDETVWWVYGLLLGYQLLLSFFLVITLIFTISLLPVIAVHLQAQYMILDKRLRPLGRQDYFRDTGGHDWESSEKGMCSQNPATRSRASRESKLHRRKQWIENSQSRLEFDLLRGAVQQHQRLLQFQQEMKEFFTPAMVPLTICNYTCFGLNIYQLAVHPADMSGWRFFRFLCQLIVLCIAYFLISDCSEVTANCSHILHRAVHRSRWYNCTPATRRSLCMMLRRLQRDNRLDFYQGLVLLSRARFLRVVRLGYTFANTMRMRASERF